MWGKGIGIQYLPFLVSKVLVSDFFWYQSIGRIGIGTGQKLGIGGKPGYVAPLEKR